MYCAQRSVYKAYAVLTSHPGQPLLNKFNRRNDDNKMNPHMIYIPVLAAGPTLAIGVLVSHSLQVIFRLNKKAMLEPKMLFIQFYQLNFQFMFFVRPG